MENDSGVWGGSGKPDGFGVDTLSPKPAKQGGRIASLVLLVTIAVLLIVVGVVEKFATHKIQVIRRSAIAAVLAQVNANAALQQELGAPVVVASGTRGKVTMDKTGWQEARLLVPVRGRFGQAVARIAAGRVKGAWTFSTFQVVFGNSRTGVDLQTGKETQDDVNGVASVKNLPAAPLPFTVMKATPPDVPADYPCVVGGLGESAKPPQLTMCPIDVDPGGPVDEAEADLRYGHMVLRETDLYDDDVFQVPLTRTYTSIDWATNDHVHAFGRNTSFYWNMAPRGTRFPYTYQYIVLADGDVLYFRRVSVGGSYSNAVFQHTQTNTRFYKATQRWNGHGWTLRLVGGEQIFFPDSYNAKNLAQGAPTEIRDGRGNVLKLIRGPKRNLNEIQTPHGHWIRMAYDGDSRIVRAEDDGGNWAEYGYNQDGLLSVVLSSTGRVRHFEYSGGVMVEVTDKYGKALLKNWYVGVQLVRQQFSDGEEFSYRYVTSKDHAYYTKVYVTLPDHSAKVINVGGYIPGFEKGLKYKVRSK